MEQKQPQQRHFQTLRLHTRDYGSNGAYFVTICAYERHPYFAIPELETILRQQWYELPQRFRHGLSLDRFVIMPDHIHFIVWINTDHPARPTLSEIVGAYKSLSANAWLQHLREIGSKESGKIWQRNYYERIIRNKQELEATRLYIENNPIVAQSKM